MSFDDLRCEVSDAERRLQRDANGLEVCNLRVRLSTAAAVHSGDTRQIGVEQQQAEGTRGRQASMRMLRRGVGCVSFVPCCWLLRVWLDVSGQSVRSREAACRGKAAQSVQLLPRGWAVKLKQRSFSRVSVSSTMVSMARCQRVDRSSILRRRNRKAILFLGIGKRFSFCQFYLLINLVCEITKH